MRWMLVTAMIAIAALSLPASGQVHRCKDATGHLTYSDQPCDAGKSGGVIERQKSREQILEDRLQAAEANERKYRAQGAERERLVFDQQQQQSQAQQRQDREAATKLAPQNLAASRECKSAKNDLEFASRLPTKPKADKQARMNAAIAKVNASCGSNTELIQEPLRRSRHPANITHCDSGFCYDSNGGVFHKAGPDFMTGPDGRTCNRAGDMWLCN